MTLYSCLLTLALLMSSPWWMLRMLTSGRYRSGFWGRLGAVPRSLREACAERQVIWLHAVSVGEVLAAEKLVAELQQAFPEWIVAVSTTTATGQKTARERFAGAPVFYMPLDFAWTVRRYLGVLRPRLLVLVESELWPRLLTECGRAGVPMAVVNARVSDRSLPRYLMLKKLWEPLLGKVSLFLAQGEESAGRLSRIGVNKRNIQIVGSLKYDAPVTDRQKLVPLLRAHLPQGCEFLVCGSTLDGEEAALLKAWLWLRETGHTGVLMLAPRHPQRFEAVARLVGKSAVRLSAWIQSPHTLELGDILLLDSMGSLAAVYELATVAFVGGSLVRKGGHNPLEPARFGVPVIMGPSYENFREIVEAMRAMDAVWIVEEGGLGVAMHQAMSRGRAMGRRGREFFEAKAGATERTLGALEDLLSQAKIG